MAPQSGSQQGLRFDDLPEDAWDSATLLASKVYYFLGGYDEVLFFALGAGGAFEAKGRVVGSEEYAETVVCKSYSFSLCT